MASGNGVNIIILSHYTKAVGRIMVFSGYLTKRGSFVPSWKRRYFELDVDVLIYYEFEGFIAITSYSKTKHHSLTHHRWPRKREIANYPH